MKPVRHLQAARIVEVQPPIYPLTLTEVKANLRVEHDEEDDLILAYLDYATRHCADYTRRALIAETRTYQVYEFPTIGKNYWKFYGCPVKEVTKIEYRTDDMMETDDPLTIDPETYTLDKITEPARITPLAGFPQESIKNFGAQITLQHGYDSPDQIPGGIKQAIHLIVGHFYENREDSVEKLPKASQRLLDPYRIFEY